MSKRERKMAMKIFKLAAKCACVAFALGALTAAAFAAELTDIKGHWAEDYIEYGVQTGYINGYLDSTFKPDNSVSRAEFSKMINSALGITKKSDITFKDVNDSDWFYPEIQKALYAGYVTGYEDGSFLAQNTITRQEAAVILSRIATRPETEKKIDSFKDCSDVASWAKGAFEFAFSKGYFTGNDLGQLQPNAVLTRAQAAKILYTIKKEENIHNGDYTVTSAEALLSETIFTDGVTFSTAADNASLSLDGCKVFGTLTVKTSDRVAVKFMDTDLYALKTEKSQANISADEKTNIKFVQLDSPCLLEGDGYENVFLKGASLASGITEISGKPGTVTVSSDAVIKAKELDTLKVADTASVMIQSGNIKNMEVTASAANSVVTIVSGAVVENLEVKAVSSFMGSGKIKNANNGVSGVTYATKPEKLTGKDAGNDDSSDDEENPAEGFIPISVYPVNNSTKVAVNADITITFSSMIYDNSETGVSSSYVEEHVELRRGSASGTKIDFDATLTSSKRILIEPEDELSYNTKYYLILKEGAFRNASGEKNPLLKYSFTTEQGQTNNITFTPTTGSEKVDTQGNLKITFSGAVKRTDGTTPTTAYLSSTAVELREKSLSGTKVEINATINSTGKIITVDPVAALKPNTVYYLIVASGTLEYSDGTNISRSYSKFTTADELKMTVTPASQATGISPDTDITIEFNTEVFRTTGSNVTTSYLTEQVLEFRKGSSSGTKVDFTAVLSSDRKTVSIIPAELDSATRYYIIVLPGTLATANGTENLKLTSYFNTASAMSPVITPANNDNDVLPASNITVEFTDELYDKNKNRITSEYVEENVIVLRKNSSSGTKLTYEAQISSDYKKITIVPAEPLSANTTYYVLVNRSTLFNIDGKSNASASSTFKTSYSNAPDFLPYNGEEDVEIERNIEITFDRKMYAIGGQELNTTYVKNNVIELYKDSYDGTAVAFSVTLSSDKQTIIVNPTNDLKGSSTYVVVIRKASLEDSEGNENAFFSSSFVTEETVSTVYTIKPENKEKNVLTTASVVVSFESPVYRANGSLASGAYIANNVLELRKGSTSGTKIACIAQISDDNKVITLTPEKALDPNTTYYVKVVSGALCYSDSTAVTSKTSYFTTNDGNPVVNTFEVTQTGASFVTLSFSANVDSTAYVRLYDTNDKIEADPVEVKADEWTVVTLTDLASNHEYTASVYVKDAAGNTSVAKTMKVKTKEPFEFAIEEITEKSAVVTVSAFCEGTIEIGYKNTSTGEKISRVSGLVLKADTNRSFTISSLDSNTKYEVYADFTDTYGKKMSLTKKFTTLEPKEEILEILSVTLTDSNGDVYTSDVKNGNVTFTTEKATYINIEAKVSIENAKITYNGGQETAPGEQSQKIIVAPGETENVEIVLTSLDTQNSVSCTVTVNVNA